MLLYLLKFSICLAIFLAFYKLFLEKQAMHFFKRYYLLAAIVLALGIPLITFTTYVNPSNVSPLVIEEFPLEFETISTAVIETSSVNYWPIILWSTYGLGVLIFGFKFIKNLSQLIYKIKYNPKQITPKTTNVLLNEEVTPHTFLRYIFFNKQKFDAKIIPQEVFWHEETHAKQKHSIDVLLIEVLQVIFWFNPLIYFTKIAIKLNHEFLADQGVLNKGIMPTAYQQILLAFSANKSESDLANAINYSLIKKRFTIMKTQTTKRAVLIRSLVLLPLLALTLYSFSNTVEVEKEVLSNNNLSINTPILNVEQNYLLWINEKETTLETINEDFNKLTHNSKSDLKLISKDPVSVQFIDEIYKAIGNNISKIITTVSETTVVDESYFYTQDKATPEQIKEYNKLVQNINKKSTNKYPIIKVKDIERVKYIHSLMSNSQKNNSEKLPDFSAIPVLPIPTPGIIQEKATPEQIKEYNRLAKHYNNLPKDNLVIKLKDMTRIRKLYNLMSDAQKKKAEPISNFSVPRPPSPTKNLNQEQYLLKGIPYPTPLPNNATTQEKRNYEKAVEEYKNQGYGYKYKDNGKEVTVIINDIAPPPPPIFKRPPPPPPLKKSKNEPNESESQKIIEKEIVEESEVIEERNLDYQKSREEIEDNFNDRQKKYQEQEKNKSKAQKRKDLRALKKYAKNHPEAVSKTTLNGEEIEIIEIPQDDHGSVTINGITYYYSIKGGETTYYNKFGNIIDSKNLGKEIENKKNKKIKTGTEVINGESYYYFTDKKGKRNYYNKWGSKIDVNSRQ